MKFRRYAKLDLGLSPVDIVPFVNVVFLLLIFFVLTSSLVMQRGLKIGLPRALTSDIIQEESQVITLPAEDEVYFNSRKVNLKELDRALKSVAKKNRQLLIKADRRVSLGRVTEIWNMCRDSGMEKVNIATTQP